MLVTDRHVAKCLAPIGGSKNRICFICRRPRSPRIAPRDFHLGRNIPRRSYKPLQDAYKGNAVLNRLRAQLNFDKRPPTNLTTIEVIHQQLERLVKENPNDECRAFTHEINTILKDWKGLDSSRQTPPVFELLRKSFVKDGVSGLHSKIRHLYYGRMAYREFSESNRSEQAKLADFRYPIEWYPATRMIQRVIHLHVGPTNSGKTYNALKRLEQAKCGIYAGPLRLLAHEIYLRLNAKGKACNLITGDERLIREDENVLMSSCTVEMVPLNNDIDVAVIDEIQMIGDEDRGWAWTQALLGLRARELHLCGEARVIPLIRELAAATGDKLEIHHYERLNPLKTMSSSLHGKFTALRKGDCVIAFSRVGIHALKAEIEKLTGRLVAVVYGSLPPEIRAQQARLFNDPDNEYDFLVASDAIGMGLNLSIKRMVFESTWKFNGKSYEPVSDAQIKQIAGRAGRYRTARQDLENQETPISGAPPEQNLGLVTTLEQMDLPQLSRAMQSEAQPIMSAGIFPPDSVVLRFAAYFPPDTPFSYILLRLHELSLMHPRFHLCKLRDGLFIADVIHSVQNLTINDRIVFCAAPASAREPNIGLVLQDLAKCVANNESGALLEIPNLNLDILNEPVTEDKNYLSKLESLHKALVLYLWLSYRFDGVFTSKAMAFYVKGLVEANIDKVLTQFSSKSRRRRRLKSLRHKAMLEEFVGQDWQRIPLDEASRTEKSSGIDRLLPTAKANIGSHAVDQTILESTPFLQKSMIATQ